MGLKDELVQIVGLRRCDRTFKKMNIEDLVEDEAMPGILVTTEAFEREGFDEQAARERRERVQHYFRT